MADSNVIGSVETDVRVNRASQTQSGLLNKQEAAIGSVSDSNVIGSVKTNVRVNRFSQTRLGPAWSKKPRDSPQQMGDEDEQVSHDDIE